MHQTGYVATTRNCCMRKWQEKEAREWRKGKKRNNKPKPQNRTMPSGGGGGDSANERNEGRACKASCRAGRGRRGSGPSEAAFPAADEPPEKARRPPPNPGAERSAGASPPCRRPAMPATRPGPTGGGEGPAAPRRAAPPSPEPRPVPLPAGG